MREATLVRRPTKSTTRDRHRTGRLAPVLRAARAMCATALARVQLVLLFTNWRVAQAVVAFDCNTYQLPLQVLKIGSGDYRLVELDLANSDFDPVFSFTSGPGITKMNAMAYNPVDGIA